MRVIVCGGRHWTDRGIIEQEIRKIIDEPREHQVTILEGGAKGADHLAGVIANELGLGHITYHANWKLHGKGAGPMRNQRMLTEGNPELVLAFPHKDSKGTWDMVGRAKRANIPVRICPSKEEEEL